LELATRPRRRVPTLASLLRDDMPSAALQRIDVIIRSDGVSGEESRVEAERLGGLDVKLCEVRVPFALRLHDYGSAS